MFCDSTEVTGVSVDCILHCGVFHNFSKNVLLVTLQQDAELYLHHVVIRLFRVLSCQAEWLSI